MKIPTKCLFGGALLSAGLTVGGAQAQQFQIGYTAAHIFTYEFGSFNFDYATQYTNGDFNIGAGSYGAYAYAVGTLDFGPSLMAAKATAGSFGAYAYAHDHDLFSYFTVDQNLNATVDWDFTQANSGFSNYLTIVDTSTFTTIFSGVDDSGTTQLPLSAGITYLVQATADVTADQGGFGTSRWSIAVPAPGSAALVGLAGLTAVRRRQSSPQVE